MVTRMINESENYVIKRIEGQGTIILRTNEFYKKICLKAVISLLKVKILLFRKESTDFQSCFIKKRKGRINYFVKER